MVHLLCPIAASQQAATRSPRMQPLASCYSNTASLMMLAGLSHATELVSGQDFAKRTTWSNSQLKAPATAHATFIQEYRCSKWAQQDIDAPQAPIAGTTPAAAADAAPFLLIPHLNQLGSYANRPGKMPKMLRKEDAHRCPTNNASHR